MKKAIQILIFFAITLAFGQQDSVLKYRIVEGKRLNIIQFNNDGLTTCFDGIQNGNETGVDCGGSCAPCFTPPSNVEFTEGPTVVEVTSTGFRVEWGTNVASDGIIFYGPENTSESLTNQTTREVNFLNFHSQPVPSASSTTTYFRVRGITAEQDTIFSPILSATTLSNAPVANFTQSNTIVEQGSTVTFTDTSTNSPTSWSWTFEGGTPPTSTIQNPTVTYNGTGTYDVTLTASNADGFNIVTRTNLITSVAPSVPVANFLASRTNPTIGTNVNFTDTSTNNPTSWSWSFPGGTPATSTLENPTVTYAVAGTYDVSLTTTNAAGSSPVETKVGYITAVESGGGDPVYTRINPTGTPPAIVTTYTPTSAADLSNPANADKIAIISNTFNAAGVVLAPGQIIRPAGGQISGTNIDLNGAYIESNFLRAFSSDARFTNLYTQSRLSPDNFGGTPNNAVNDMPAITALIYNSAFAIFQAGGTYLINEDRRAFFNPISREGILDWNMNFATIATTDNSTFRHRPIVNYPTIANPGDYDQQGYYLLPLQDMSTVNIYDGTFNGNQLASRCLDITNTGGFYLDNLTIINYWAPAFAIVRAIAISINPRPAPSGDFTNGWITNCLIENINSPGNNIPNDVTGIAKGMTFTVRDNGFSNIYINNNTIRTIIGDDAEGFYSNFADGYTNAGSQVWFHIRNNNWIGNSRRCIKFDTSNAIIEDNYMESLPFAVLGDTGPKQAAMIQAFSIDGSTPVENIFVRRNEVRVLNDAYNSLWGITDARNVIVEDNIFYADVMTAQRTISISTSSTQNGLYTGDVTDYVFRNNTITNVRFGMGALYNVLGAGADALIENNTFTYTNVNPGKYYGLIENTSGPMNTSDRIIFRGNTYNINYPAGSVLFQGLVGSQVGTINNITLENCTIDYTNASGIPTNPFAKIGRTASDNLAGFGPSNIIENCTIIGASGTDAIRIFGPGQPTIVNSFGAGATPITVEQ